MKRQLHALHCLITTCLLVSFSSARAADHDAHSPPVISGEPAAALLVNPPLAETLARGLVVVPFRTEHLKIVPVYGEAALAIVPRIGHLHVSVDRAPWHWLHASEEPIVVQGLSHGPHQLTLELADANHHPLAVQTLEFVVP